MKATLSKIKRLSISALIWLVFISPVWAGKRPNVILFLADDMGWMDSGVYGSKYYDTPNIDAFAQTGMRFTDAYAHPICSPTRAAILTGKTSARHGIIVPSGHVAPHPPGFNYDPNRATPNKAVINQMSRNHLDLDEETLAEVLQKAGYRTALIGKWHLGLNEEHWPDKQGFETTFHCAPDPGPPAYFSPYNVKPPGFSGKSRRGNISDGPPGEYIVDRQAEEAVKFMRSAKDAPFFLYLSSYGVHGPWGHKEEYTARFKEKTDPRGVQNNPVMASMLKSVDDCFGRILKEVKALKLTDDTIVIFYSDNGGNNHSDPGAAADNGKGGAIVRQLAESYRQWAGTLPPTDNTPLRAGKGRLYEGGVRVPMIWSWPGHIGEGTVCQTVTGDIDIYPTLLELLKIAAPADISFDGVSLAGVLTRSEQLVDRPYFIYSPLHNEEGQISVRLGDFKLMRSYSPHFPSQLYNLKEDIGETRNLVAEMPEQVAALSKSIDQFFARTGLPAPRPNPAFNPEANRTEKDEDESSK
jgi:arylsulfatase A-like enzyme